MIKHIVMWRFADAGGEDSKANNIKESITKLESLLGKVPTLKTLEVGENFNPTEAAFDLVLTTTHEDKQGLADYQSHPDHVEVAKFIGPKVETRTVVDYEL